MRTAPLSAIVGSLFLGSALVSAEDVVRGYRRGDGTYVQPHYRSNIYGPSTNSWELLDPRSRDWDSDGIPNYLDDDDDNDGYSDNVDSSQYGDNVASSRFGWLW